MEDQPLKLVKFHCWEGINIVQCPICAGARRDSRSAAWIPVSISKMATIKLNDGVQIVAECNGLDFGKRHKFNVLLYH